MGKRSTWPVLACFTLFALVLAGCKSDSTSPTTSADLVGTYSLVSVTQAGVTFGPPVATGTLTLTATQYTVNLSITIPGAGTETEQDAGTYTVSGSNWSQTSTTNQGLQSVGTYSLSGNKLNVNVTTQGQQVATVWQKQ